MMMETIKIRLMELEDLEEVRQIDRLSFSLPWPESAYRHELLENPASMSWVAEASDLGGESKIVGMVVVWLILDEAHIATLAVHPAYRRKGIGSRLLKQALIEAVDRGARRAMLEVRANNATAQSMYHRFGFVVVYRRPRYYRDNNEDALLMNLDHLAERVSEWEFEQDAIYHPPERGDK
jgi:ribosomal-protein-alanine N-acetyltransferase